MMELLILGGAVVGMYLVGKEDKKAEQVDNKPETTYNYWIGLTYAEQFEYFTTNEYLKDYVKNDYYSTNRELTARHVQAIADKLNREFTNKYNRY